VFVPGWQLPDTDGDGNANRVTDSNIYRVADHLANDFTNHTTDDFAYRLAVANRIAIADAYDNSNSDRVADAVLHADDIANCIANTELIAHHD
jgi:hypothetical protein